MPQPFLILTMVPALGSCVCEGEECRGGLNDNMGKLPTHTCELHVLGSVPLLTYNPSQVPAPSFQAHCPSQLWID